MFDDDSEGLMARSGLDKHRKFLRLAQRLNHVASGMGEIFARGVLETLWGAAYERADDYLGDSEDVEAAARWRGEPGYLTRALLTAGGEDAVGFIEPTSPGASSYQIHDLWDHAPPWVKRKAEKEAARRANGQTISDVRREAALRSRTPFAGNESTTGQQTVDHLLASGAAKVSPGKGREGTGRDGIEDPPVSPPRGTPAGFALQVEDPKAKRDAIEARATVLLAELSQARMAVMPTAKALKPLPANLKGIMERLREGFTDEDVRTVIRERAAEVRRKPDAGQWFDAVTPFRSANFSRSLNRPTGLPQGNGNGHSVPQRFDGPPEPSRPRPPMAPATEAEWLAEEEERRQRATRDYERLQRQRGIS